MIILAALMVVGCEIESMKKVGYGKQLDNAVDDQCFEKIFINLKQSTHYSLSLDLEKTAGKITFYNLTVDGTDSADSHEVFTQKSFQLSKKFMNQVIEKCSY
ncbi:MAG: hypothetical protein ACFHVJ_09920 [Aestuariibacter sp.]